MGDGVGDASDNAGFSDGPLDIRAISSVDSDLPFLDEFEVITSEFDVSVGDRGKCVTDCASWDIICVEIPDLLVSDSVASVGGEVAL